MDLCIFQDLFVVVLCVLLLRHVVHRLLLALIVRTPLPRRPKASFGNVGQGSSELNFNLRGVAVLEQGFGDVLVEEVDLFNGLVLQELLDDSPNNGDGGGDPDIVARKQSGAVVVGEEAESLPHAVNHGKHALVARVNKCNPVFDLARDEVVLDDVLKQVDLRFQNLVFRAFQSDHLLNVIDDNWPIVAVLPHDVEYSFRLS
jgi:hypothetical protein